MSGHSKWSTIKHKKGAKDIKRGKVFSKVIKEITVAAKLGGEAPESNPRLRSAMALARSVNMPADNIQRAIKKGSGNAADDKYEEILYEGYGPHNIAVIVSCLTDNKNRTVSNLRTIFHKNKGNLGTTNAVAFMFKQVGMIEIPKNLFDEDKMTELALEVEADDFDSGKEDVYALYTDSKNLHKIQTYFEEHNYPIYSAALVLVPLNKSIVDDVAKANQIIRFLDILEDDEDVQKVYTNFEIDDSILGELQE